MSRENEGRQELTLTEIASIADVSPSAVSNWRKRGLGFPNPTRTVGREERFSASEIYAWLSTRPQRKDPKKPRRRTSQNAPENLTVNYEMALCALVSRLESGQREQLLELPDTDLFDEARRLTMQLEADGRVPQRVLARLSEPNAELVRLLATGRSSVPPESRPDSVLDPDDGGHWLGRDLRHRPNEPAEVFEETDAWRQPTSLADQRRFVTPKPVSALMADLLPTEAHAVYDPAAGEAHLLLATALHTGAATVAGFEIDPDAWATGMQRLLVHGITAHVRHGDAMTDISLAHGDLYDVVVCDPPSGTKATPSGGVAAQFRRAGSASPDMQWLLHCLDRLAPGGTAVVTQPAIALTREGADAEVRRQLVGEGWLKAVLVLPTNLIGASSPTAVLLLEHRPANVRATDILFADLTQVDAATTGGTVDNGHPWADIARDVRKWRHHPNQFHPREGVTTLVPILDVLRNKAPLSPQYWIDTQARLAAREHWVSDHATDLESLHNAITGLDALEPPDPYLAWQMGEPPPLVPVRTLAEAGVIDLIRGAPLEKADFTVAGHPVLTAASFDEESASSSSALTVERFVSSPLDTVTHPGDVVVLPRGRAIRAVVDAQGGHGVAAPLLILRRTSPTAPPAELLAALVTSPRIQSLATGGVIKSVSTRTLSLPRLDPHTADAAAGFLDHLDQLEAAAHTVLERIETLRTSLITGLEAGAKAEPPE